MNIELDDNHKIKDASHLHWYHWFVFILSLILTFSAWYYTKTQADEKIHNTFKREANKTIELITERMVKYEDMLWSAAGLFRSSNKVSAEEWARFSNTIGVEKKYPGINGIGVIALVHKNHYDNFVQDIRTYQSDFTIHPKRNAEYYLPITYLEPKLGNEAAIGLDMAHEKNRYNAAIKTLKTGKANITGPITLVQDSGKTPGFLFFVPVLTFENDILSASKTLKQGFTIVYAPFVVKKLMEGTLASAARHVSIKITDGKQAIYNEQQPGYAKYDPNPLFKTAKNLNWYGRQWQFEIFSDLEFRQYAVNYQPMTILVGGLVIDTLLLVMFFMMVRSNKKAYEFGMNATLSLREKTKKLEKSNKELEKFAYVASHDLKAPLRGIENLITWIEEDDQNLSDISKEHLSKINMRVQRMNALIKGILEYSVIQNNTQVDQSILEPNRLLNEIVEQYNSQKDITVSVQDDIPPLSGNPVHFKQVFSNIISNGLKYNDKLKKYINIDFDIHEDHITFKIQDNGIGIDERMHDKIFELFHTLQSKDILESSGVGLAIVRKILDENGDQIWLESKLGEGSNFYFTWPLKKDANSDRIQKEKAYSTGRR